MIRTFSFTIPVEGSRDANSPPICICRGGELCDTGVWVADFPSGLFSALAIIKIYSESLRHFSSQVGKPAWRPEDFLVGGYGAAHPETGKATWFSLERVRRLR